MGGPENRAGDRDSDDTVLRPAPRAADAVGSDVEDTVLRHVPPADRSGAGRPGPVPSVPDASAPRRASLRFRIGDDDPLPLDVTALIGRRPVPPRVLDAPTRLVTVPSPSGQVSGTHLELAQVGEVVVATDLRSTNGTVVRLTGARPRRLRPGESLVVAPGTTLDLGDGIVVEILSRPRLGS